MCFDNFINYILSKYLLKGVVKKMKIDLLIVAAVVAFSQLTVSLPVPKAISEKNWLKKLQTGLGCFNILVGFISFIMIPWMLIKYGFSSTIHPLIGLVVLTLLYIIPLAFTTMTSLRKKRETDFVMSRFLNFYLGASKVCVTVFLWFLYYMPAA